MIVDTFQSLNESYLLFHIPVWFLMVHFICGFSLSTNEILSFLPQVIDMIGQTFVHIFKGLRDR